MSVIYLMVASAITPGCGWIGTGSLPVNEREPSGSIVSQGRLEGMNGANVSGTAAVYRTTSGSYTIRLEGLDIDGVGGVITLNAKITGRSDYRTTLRFFSGNTNYPTGISDGSYGTYTFTEITLEASVQVPPEIAKAILINPD